MVQVNYLTTMMALIFGFYMINIFPVNYIFILLLFHTLIHLADKENVFSILLQEATKIFQLTKENIPLIIENPGSYVQNFQEKYVKHNKNVN